MTTHTRPGYIMMVSLMILAVLIVIVTYVATRSHTYSPFAKHAQRTMQSQLLAASGLQIAIAQLTDFSNPKAKADEQGQEKKLSADEKKKKFFEKVLPVLNNWQSFELKKAVDGIDGRIQIVLSCEDGKLDLNQLWDFEKNRFIFDAEKNKNEWQALLQAIFSRIEQLTGGKQLFSALQQLYKERGYVINDPTELLLLKEYYAFKDTLFYDPSAQKKDSVYLTDIFTVWSGQKTIDPWLLTHSWRTILELKKPEELEPLAKNFKVQNEWKDQWDTVFLPSFEKNFSSLPKNIELILNTKFDPKIFSVLCYGMYAGITTRMLAIVQLQESTQKDSSDVEIVVRKLYWL